jgi:hypothetical protein
VSLFVCESAQERAEGFHARRTSEGRKDAFDILVRADKAAASALGIRGSNKCSIIVRVDTIRPFNGRKGDRVFNGLGCFDQRTEIEIPQRRARSLERDHRELLVNAGGRSEFQSLFKGCSGRRARLGGDSVTHFGVLVVGRGKI